MKRIIAILSLFLIPMILLLSACEVQKTTNKITENTPIEKNSITERRNPNNVPNKNIDSSITIDKKTSGSPNNLKGISDKDIKRFLNSKKSGIPEAVGSENDTGTISILESHMVFPYISVQHLGLMFVFPNDIDNLNPTCIIVDKLANIRDGNMKDARPGMNFEKIIKILGDCKIKKTWISTEDNTVYKIDYTFDGVVYSFVSYEENGNDSQLFISLVDNL